MMDKPTDMGLNRTGIATSPIDSRRLISKAKEDTGAALHIDGGAREAERVTWARDADPVGTVPPPGTIKGVAKTALHMLQGHKPTVLIDKLGERLAYERTGVRLYEALLVKYEAASIHEDGPARADLEEIRRDEHDHVLLVRDAIDQLGADPTAMTPCADVAGVAAQGWVQVLGDPRTTFTQCLEVMLIVEDGDAEGWSLLIELVDGLGLDELATKFRHASAVEERHAIKVRAWLTAAVLGESGVRPTPARDGGAHAE